MSSTTAQWPRSKSPDMVKKYRTDIDGLRAFAVLVVLFFHAGIDLFSGGFVGVDIFFVISGYLITSLIYPEFLEGRFSFVDFYQRRVARILPAAAITLIAVAVFGFFLLPPDSYEALGKDLVFAAVGALNIHLGQGVDYFTKEGAIQPLVHFWSLGVEEQYYVVWPLILLVVSRFQLRSVLTIAFIFFVMSLVASIFAVNIDAKGSYYFLQYRAFELLIGSILAIMECTGRIPKIRLNTQRMVSLVGAVLIILPVFLLGSDSKFPGVNALWPCIGTALFLAYPGEGWTARILSLKPIVAVGLISYPLYLYHQPALAFLDLLSSGSTPSVRLAVVLVICVPLAWFTWAYIERPARRLVKSDSGRKNILTVGLVTTIPLVVLAGLLVNFNNGIPSRLQYLNPFALEIIENSSRTFHAEHRNGVRVTPTPEGKILFVGDSTMQQYVVPIVKSLGIDRSEVDTVTRGWLYFFKRSRIC